MRLKKTVFTLILAASLLPLPGLAQGDSSTAIEEMQNQVEELQEKMSALRKIQKREQPDLLQIENQRRYARMVRARTRPEGMVMRDAVSTAPAPIRRNRMLEFYGGTTMWAQHRTNNEDNSPGAPNEEDGMDAGYTLDLFMEANLERKHKFVVYGEVGDGNGVNRAMGTYDASTGRYSGLHSTPNYDAKFNTNGDLEIHGAYYEGLFYRDKLLVSLGKQNIHSLYDENEFAGNERTQFMSNIFVRSTGVSFQELDNYYAPGLRFMLTPVPTFEISLILANSNFDDVDENGLAVVQVNFKPANILFGGNYRFFWVFDDREYATFGSSSSTDNNVGWGLSFDQRFEEWLGCFFRLSIVDDDVVANVVEGTWSLGIELGGLLWNRPQDALGLAYGVAWINDDVSGLINNDSEKHFEAYYRYSVNEYIAISPNIQIVSDQPRTDPSTVAIFGARGQFNFRL